MTDYRNGSQRAQPIGDTPPSRDSETEQLVLADIIEHPDQLATYRDLGLQAAHFVHPLHEDLFMAIEKLERQGADPDPPHIKAVMTERGQWDVATAYFVYTTLPGQCVPRQSKANVTHSITRARRPSPLSATPGPSHRAPGHTVRPARPH